MTSLSTAPNSIAACLALAAILLCEIIQLLLVEPSLPLENKIAAVSFIDTFFKVTFLNHASWK